MTTATQTIRGRTGRFGGFGWFVRRARGTESERRDAAWERRAMQDRRAREAEHRGIDPDHIWTVGTAFRSF
ncbi:MAG: hypothetical protein FJZ92_10375 [Chloroflexi bacterium]|nr:hypothetical protein [Chloroflexota bacterium]